MDESIFCPDHRPALTPPATSQKSRGDCETGGCFKPANTTQDGRWLCDNHVDLRVLFEGTVAKGRTPTEALDFLLDN
jgi:hypothetical protein